ncbi:MAG: hypothetical protein LBC61_04850 [Candidatus Peribacteria bacterium]|jgi:hypothetical protein|nr:hypothetical protein [Candidatus Peribacteria bacterium]
MDYLSVGLSRNKDAWNERVDEFASKLTTEIFEIITSDKSKATKREKIEKLFTIDGEDKPSGFREEIYDNVIALSDKWNE